MERTWGMSLAFGGLAGFDLVKKEVDFSWEEYPEAQR